MPWQPAPMDSMRTARLSPLLWHTFDRMAVLWLNVEVPRETMSSGCVPWQGFPTLRFVGIWRANNGLSGRNGNNDTYNR